MSLFKKIGKGIGKGFKAVGKGVGAVGKVTGKVLKTAAPIATIIPGVGGIVGGASAVLGEVLSPTKQEAIEQAVERDNVVDVHKIEETIQRENPVINPIQLQIATRAMTDQTLKAVPTASINDAVSVNKISMTTKIMQFARKNALILLGVGLGAVMLLKGKGNQRTYKRRR